MKALDLNELSPYQASWQAPPDQEAMAQAEEPADPSGVIGAIQGLDPSALHPDPQMGPQLKDNATAAINFLIFRFKLSYSTGIPSLMQHS